MFDQGTLHSPVIRPGTDDHDHRRLAQFQDLPRVDKIESSEGHARQQHRNLVGISEEKLGFSSCVQPVNCNPVSSELMKVRAFQPDG